MSIVTVQKSEALSGTTTIPGDKSISHRALMFAGIAMGTSKVRGFLNGRDCLATLEIMKKLGVTIERDENGELTIDGLGHNGLIEPDDVLDCDNSGTTIRLLSGLLCSQGFCSILSGSAQLRSRPMGRIANPLREMGAIILGRRGGLLAPLVLAGTGNSPELMGFRYEMPVASAQVKSAVLLAGLRASSPTTVIEPGPARDHTERMLLGMGADLQIEENTITVNPIASPLTPLNLTIPGDTSSAAFLMVAAAIVPDSDITLTGVGLNPTRTGLLEGLQKMGANIEIGNVRSEGGEPCGDIRIQYCALNGAEFSGVDIVTMIDEIPILVVAASQAVGRTVIRDAAELRVKESDRISVTVKVLQALGAKVEERPDGFIVDGPTNLTGAIVDSHGDHRLAMALIIAGMVAEGETQVLGAEVIPDSYPGFEASLTKLGASLGTFENTN
jgi:3-phosphoshikimate 1-carboxyvinyltransferase